MTDKEYDRFKAQLIEALDLPEVREIFREAAAGVIAKMTPEQRQQVRENLNREPGRR